VLIVDDTLVPTRDHGIAERSKNYRYSTNHQVGIGADTRLFVAGWPAAGNRNDCKAWELSGAKDALGAATVIADGSYRAPAWSSRTPGNVAKVSDRSGKRNTTPPTQGPRPRGATPSPAGRAGGSSAMPPERRRRPPRHLGIARLHNLTLDGWTNRHGDRAVSASPPKIICGTAF
jgi:hypothetical protein